MNVNRVCFFLLALVTTPFLSFPAIAAATPAATATDSCNFPDLVYCQQWFGSSYFTQSQYDPGLGRFNYLAYDNFKFSRIQDINQVHWVGGYSSYYGPGESNRLVC